MSLDRPQIVTPLIMTGLVVAFGATSAWLNPDAAWLFLAVAAGFPIVWLLIERLKFHGAASEEAMEELTQIRNAITSAGLMLAIPLAMTAAYTSQFVQMNDDFEQRTMGVVFGLVFAAYGNLVPKSGVSLNSTKCDRASEQAFNRFAGRMFMITAILYAAIWAFAPLDWTLFAGMAVLVSGVGLVMLRRVLSHLSR
ncbi:hypothetical protein [Maricaulis sp.]|uniref:hypothetical protein n=1 Tax=Maricaulis sp. TaxID=1486257 RepID=UPI0026241A34|nr:hypothetical protein [Maricaulis sp.]